jgi:tripartite-type tricarboxylate transporter receptor subunit TctC
MASRGQQVFALASLVMLSLPGIAAAQGYPAREIRSVVNFPPGTGMDIMIRYYSAKLAELTGKPVLVENKPGATGNIATEYVARAKPDGYTIMITPASSTLAAAASLFKKLPFDPQRDLQPVLLLTKLGFVFVVPANSPARSMSELTIVLKNKPGHGAYGTGSNTGVVTAEMYKVRTGLTTNQVMYKGAYENFNDMYGGQIDFSTFDPTAIAEPVKTGKLHALAVTSTTRLRSFPDVPTMQEAGFSDFDLTPWIGLVVPAGTPQPIVEKLATWHRQINATDETKKMLLQFGMDPLDGDAAAMAARLKSDTAKWADYVRLAKIEPQ